MSFVGEETKIPSSKELPKFDVESIDVNQFFNKKVVSELLGLGLD